MAVKGESLGNIVFFKMPKRILKRLSRLKRRTNRGDTAAGQIVRQIVRQNDLPLTEGHGSFDGMAQLANVTG